MISKNNKKYSTDSTFGKSRKFSNATFGRIKPIVLGFDWLSLLIRTNPRTIGLIRLKVAGSNFHIFSTDSTFGKSRKFSNATFGRIKPIVLGFDPLSLLIRTNPRTIGLIRSKVAFSNFHIFSTDSTFEKRRKFWKAIFEWMKPIVLGFVPL